MQRIGKNRDIWTVAVDAQIDRLRDSINWFPFPALLSLGLVIVFFGHLLFDLNPRIHSQSDVLMFDADPSRDGGIWLSIYLDSNHLVIDTSDRRHFEIKAGHDDEKGVRDLVNYMREQAAAAAIDAGLRGEIDPLRSFVTISADQHLEYLHLRPILFAMAEAGISRYAFETKQRLLDQPR